MCLRSEPAAPPSEIRTGAVRSAAAAVFRVSAASAAMFLSLIDSLGILKLDVEHETKMTHGNFKNQNNVLEPFPGVPLVTKQGLQHVILIFKVLPHLGGSQSETSKIKNKVLEPFPGVPLVTKKSSETLF